MDEILAIGGFWNPGFDPEYACRVGVNRLLNYERSLPRMQSNFSQLQITQVMVKIMVRTTGSVSILMSYKMLITLKFSVLDMKQIINEPTRVYQASQSTVV